MKTKKTEIDVKGILSIQALAMTKGVFNQVEHLPHLRDGCISEWPTGFNPTEGLIGYVMNQALGLSYFIGKRGDKLFRIRQDYVVEYMVYKAESRVTHGDGEAKLRDMQAALPQIFLK